MRCRVGLWLARHMLRQHMNHNRDARPARILLALSCCRNITTLVVLCQHYEPSLPSRPREAAAGHPLGSSNGLPVCICSQQKQQGARSQQQGANNSYNSLVQQVRPACSSSSTCCVRLRLSTMFSRSACSRSCCFAHHDCSAAMLL